MVVWIVTQFREVRGIESGMPEIVGVFSSLEKAQNKVKSYAKSHNVLDEDLEDYIEDNFDIEKFFVDTYCLRSE